VLTIHLLEKTEFAVEGDDTLALAHHLGLYSCNEFVALLLAFEFGLESVVAGGVGSGKRAHALAAPKRTLQGCGTFVHSRNRRPLFGLQKRIHLVLHVEAFHVAH